MAKHIILAHGILGFGSLTGLPIDYFNGVASHLNSQGHVVIAPQVNPIGSVQQRGLQLAFEIKSQLPAHQKAHIIAHSMGGLDARYALFIDPELADQIETLITIGTPHRGSPVADAIANPVDPLFTHIPPFLLQWLRMNAGALNDLTTTAGIRFDDATHDVKGIRYINVAGDASKGGHELFLFQFAAMIGNLNNNEVNDGVVTKLSALKEGHEHLDDWPVDHAGEVGWSLEALIPFWGKPHLERYSSIVNMI